MNNSSLFPSTLKCGAFAVLIWCGVAQAADLVASPATNSAVASAKAPVAVPKSVFVDDVQSGKDPFFPNSARRLDSVTSTASTNVVAPVSLLGQIALKGISGTKGQFLAIINNATVAVGEVAEVKVGGRTVKVRCREIRDHSVLIELEGGGETKEIKLREGI